MRILHADAPSLHARDTVDDAVILSTVRVLHEQAVSKRQRSEREDGNESRAEVEAEAQVGWWDGEKADRRQAKSAESSADWTTHLFHNGLGESLAHGGLREWVLERVGRRKRLW